MENLNISKEKIGKISRIILKFMKRKIQEIKKAHIKNMAPIH